jgi:hypothetical protein
MKRHTTKPRRPSPQSVLQVRVMSPRIAWFGFLRILGKVTKLACVLAVFAGIGWGIWRGVQHAFYQNPDFRLQVIDLNPNPVIDELGVTATAGIDLTSNPSLFDIDVEQVGRKLRSLPEIADAHVERHLPGTLVVNVIPRTPKAWISCPDGGLPEARRAGSMLVDRDGIAYPCPALQLEAAANLPVVILPSSPGNPMKAGSKIQLPELDHCILLLDSAREADPDALHWIDTVRQLNAWSLLLVTRHGTSATFGLGDHARQIESLRAALDHAGEKGYVIETINLIPKYNIPITIQNDNLPPKDAPPPKAIPASPAPPASGDKGRRARDLGNILKRN